MEKQIAISYPESLAFSLKMGNKEFENEMKVISIIKLYELGKISSGKASNLLGISRIDFIDLLSKYKVSYFYNENFENEIRQDLNNV